MSTAEDTAARDNRLTILSAILLSKASVATFSLAPFLIGSYVDHLGLSARHSSQILSAEIVAIALSNVFAAFVWIHRAQRANVGSSVADSSRDAEPGLHGRRQFRRSARDARRHRCHRRLAARHRLRNHQQDGPTGPQLRAAVRTIPDDQRHQRQIAAALSREFGRAGSVREIWRSTRLRPCCSCAGFRQVSSVETPLPLRNRPAPARLWREPLFR